MASKTYTLKQGDLFQKSVEFNLTGHDFTGSTVRCSLRDSGGKVVQDLTIVPVSNTSGQLVVQLQATGEQTALWPVQKLMGDIEISRTSPAFGPFTPADIIVDVKKQYT